MLDFASGAPEFARTVTEARQIEASRHRWARRLDELKAQEQAATAGGRSRSLRIFGPSDVERRRAYLEQALEAAYAEGITLDEWVRVQRLDPALSERAEWAGLNDELVAMGPRGRRNAA